MGALLPSEGEGCRGRPGDFGLCAVRRRGGRGQLPCSPPPLLLAHAFRPEGAGSVCEQSQTTPRDLRGRQERQEGERGAPAAPGQAGIAAGSYERPSARLGVTERDRGSRSKAEQWTVTSPASRRMPAR